MRLARDFGGDARSWLNLQAAYDLRVAQIDNAKRIEREIAPATYANQGRDAGDSKQDERAREASDAANDVSV